MSVSKGCDKTPLIRRIPRSNWNLLCARNHPSWQGQRDLNLGTNTHFRRLWQSEGNSFARMATASSCWKRAPQPKLVCFKWLENHNSHLRNMGIAKENAYSAMARFKFGRGRVGEVRYEADIKVGIAGLRGTFTA